MFLSHNGHTLHVGLYGDRAKPAVILLHSLGASGHVWEAQIESLSSDYWLICPDFRGHGLSDLSREPLTIEALADDVLAVIAALGLAQYHIAGISIGGTVAQAVASANPVAVLTLTLFDSTIVTLAPQMWRDRAAKIRSDGLASIAAGVLGRWVTPSFLGTPAGRGLATMLARTPDEGYAAGCDAIAIADRRAGAAALTMPVTVIVGELDEATPLAASKAIADAVPRSELHIIAGGAHVPLLEKVDAANALLRASLQRH